jgi:hypothetical protein
MIMMNITKAAIETIINQNYPISMYRVGKLMELDREDKKLTKRFKRLFVALEKERKIKQSYHLRTKYMPSHIPHWWLDEAVENRPEEAKAAISRAHLD